MADKTSCSVLDSVGHIGSCGKGFFHMPMCFICCSGTWLLMSVSMFNLWCVVRNVCQEE